MCLITHMHHGRRAGDTEDEYLTGKWDRNREERLGFVGHKWMKARRMKMQA